MKENKNIKNVNQKKGISLIVLVITIIVIVILAVAVILSIANNNPIDNANKAKFQNDVKSMQEELELTKAKKYADNNGKLDNAELSLDNLTSASKYKDKFVINNGELKYLSSKLTDEEKKWVTELGIEAGGIVLANGEAGVTIELNTEGKKVLKTDWRGGNMPTNISTDIIIPNGVEEIEKWSFVGADITSVVIPDTVTKVGQETFMGCSKLSNVTLSKNLEALSGYMFGGCTSLTNIVISEGCKNLSNAFSGCSSLASIALPSTLERMGMGCFGGCTSLKDIEIPDSVVDAGLEAAFRDENGNGLPNLTVKMKKSTAVTLWSMENEEEVAEKLRVGRVVFK